MIDLNAIFQPQTPLLEIVVRGTAIYWALFLLLRLAPRRQAGSIGVSDLLVIVLIADAVQNALISQSDSVFDGIIIVAVILFWSYAFDWLGYHVPQIEKFIQPPPLALVKNGQILHRNLRRELITMQELRMEMREQGVENVEDIKLACMESDGRISILKQS